jgi:hypothetical protein
MDRISFSSPLITYNQKKKETPEASRGKKKKISRGLTVPWLTVVVVVPVTNSGVWVYIL